ncbi:hypothetical protein D3C79_415820 [compost metagenome]
MFSQHRQQCIRLGAATVVADQLRAYGILVNQHQRLFDPRLRQQAGLDFLGFDTEATHFDLLVEAAKVFQCLGLHLPAGAVATAVQALAIAVGPGHEALGGEARAAQVATGQACTAEVQLARYTGGGQFQLVVQHTAQHIAQRAADRRAFAIGGLAVPVGDVDGGFGRAIAVVQLHLWQHLQHTVTQCRGQRFATGEQPAQAAAGTRLRLLNEHLQQRRHEVQRGHAMGLHQRGDALRVAVLARAGEHQLATGHQWPEAFPHRNVEADRRLLHQHVAVVQHIAGLHPLQALGQCRVGIAHALGLAGGAGGVDHIGQVVAMQVQPGGMAWPAVQVQLVEGDGADAVHLWQLAQQVAVAQQQASVAVGEHVGQALGRVIDVQRHIGTTGLENGQQADQQLRRTLDGDGHAGVGADAFVTQVVGQTVGLLVQLGVIQAATVPHQGGALRGQACLVIELLDQQALRRRSGCLAPAQQLRAARLIEQLHLAQRPLRSGTHLLKQGQQVLGQALDGTGIEQFGGIVEGQAQAALVVFFTVQLQVELGFATVPRQLFGQQARQAAQGRQVTLLVVEHDLEQALLASLGQGFEQLLERQVLVGLGIQGGLAHLGQQLVERQAAIELRTQYLGVDEEADHALGFQARAVGVGHADTDIGLAAVAVQQRLPAGQQHHEQAGLLFAGQALERFGEPGRYLEVEAGGAVVALAGARVVGAQVEHRQFIPQTRLPVLQLTLGFACGQPLSLPGAVVGITQGQRCQVGLEALAMGGVQFGEFVEQDVQRPAVGDDMVQGHPQLMVFIVQARQGHPQQRPPGQVERLASFGFALGGDLFGGLAFEVQAAKVERLLRLDALQGLAVLFGKQGTQ